MKRAITFYIDDDMKLIAFCGTLCTQRDDVKGVTLINFTPETIAETNEWYVPLDRKAEPYKEGKE